MLGTDTSCKITNYPESQVSFVTSSGGCVFDQTGDPRRQFKAMFTPDPPEHAEVQDDGPNPGQFLYSVFHSGSGPTTFNITLPYPFVTQGNVPIHAYSSVSVGSDGCYRPGTEFYSNSQKVTLGDYPGTWGTTKTVSVTLNSPGFVYLTMHLDYGLKGFGNYEKGINNSAISTTSPQPINDLVNHTFGVTGAETDSDTVQNKNVFKHDPGFAGLVRDTYGNPVVNTPVQIYQGTALKQTVYTDADGWYVWTYKYTGKATTFTLKLPAFNLSQSATLKSNGFMVVNFTVP